MTSGKGYINIDRPMTTQAMEPTTETVPLLDGDAVGSPVGAIVGDSVGDSGAAAGANVGGIVGANVGGSEGVNLTFDLNSQFCFGLKKT
jgi:phage tail tape-measure protein